MENWLVFQKDEAAKNKKNLKTKKRDNKTILIFKDNFIYEYSLKYKKITYLKKQNTYDKIISFATTNDERNHFIADQNKGFYQLNTRSHKQIFNFDLNEKIGCIHLTCHNRSLIIADIHEDKLIKWCMKNKKPEYEWSNNINKSICSISSCHKNKYLFTGYNGGYLAIFNLEKNIIVKTYEAFKTSIYSMVLTRNNQYIYVSDETSNVKKMNLNTLEFIEEYKKLGFYYTYSICLTNDEENLLVPSYKQ